MCKCINVSGSLGQLINCSYFLLLRIMWSNTISIFYVNAAYMNEYVRSFENVDV